MHMALQGKVHAISTLRSARMCCLSGSWPQTAIRHIVYIIKENRTYDQLFGDMKEGNGDPDYCLFPDKITPNHHALAREFVLIDNLYHNAEVSATGHLV